MEENNNNILVDSNKLIKMNNFDIIQFDNSNEIESSDDETNEIEEQITDDMYTNYNTRYENIIELLGLNININYPIKIIVDGIIELYMKNESTHVKSKYARCFKFVDNIIAKKICSNLFDHNHNNHHTYHISIMSLQTSLRRLHRHYKYNKIASKIDKPNDIINKNNNKESNLGFNYNNPRWYNLTSMVI
jgi:hypothetical protein